MSNADLFSSALGPEAGTRYRLSRAIGDTFADRAVIEITGTFDVEEFASAKRCEIAPRVVPHPKMETSWQRDHGLHRSMETGLYDVRWDDRELIAMRAEWVEGYHRTHGWYVIAEDRAVAEAFTRAVCEYCNHPHATVLAFRGGCWSKDRDLYDAIQGASFDDLVLAGALANEIQEDFMSFLAAKEQYAKYGVPWKRGVLFLGPPGNGKTHCLRATIKLLDVPCLYVQSFKSRYDTDDANIAQVFARAREVTPCCLVFEDLDALINDENRSTFLNQLDGFANASGMLTLATTNHPERLDPAIVERPSRFDRKYHFDLPNATERGRYIASWRERLDASMRITDEEVDSLVAGTEDFSFAYLKELFLSAMIRWMKHRETGTMSSLLSSQLTTLRHQMTTERTAPPRVSKPTPSPFDF